MNCLPEIIPIAMQFPSSKFTFYLVRVRGSPPKFVEHRVIAAEMARATRVAPTADAKHPQDRENFGGTPNT